MLGGHFPGAAPGALGLPGAEARYDSWAVIGPQLEAVLQTGKGLSATDEHLPVIRDGEIVDAWWTYSLSPICDETGVPLGVISQGNDTTIRAQAERSLRASEERLQMALDASGDVGTWEWDLINDVVVGDDRMARLYGVDPRFADEGAPASTYLQHIHPDDFEPLSAVVQAGVAHGRPISHEYRLVFPDGTERWLS